MGLRGLNEAFFGLAHMGLSWFLTRKLELLKIGDLLV
jgi:hypothetical protein